MEALIASQLDPKQFGTYMATGSKKGASERIIFCRLSGEFGDHFDWEYARAKCIPHSYRDPKHSVYLGVYRVFEHIPAANLDALFLTTRDGRTLELESSDNSTSRDNSEGFFIYQELCPVNPVIVSRLDPEKFAQYVTDEENKISMPHVMFADLKVIDLKNPERTGNIGAVYDRKIPHLMECIASVTTEGGKINRFLTQIGA